MKTNFFNRNQITTFECGPSSPIPALQRLKRLTMACMLWEDTFYVDGKTIIDQIQETCKQVKPEKIVEVALDAHSRGLLRHVPLLLIVAALKRGAQCKEAIAMICNRPDQMTELLSLYWKDGKKPLPAQLKKGLARAFQGFDEYQLAKWNKHTPIKLRDVLFLCHAKPKDKEQEDVWKRLVTGELSTPDTWEVRLSSGADKKESFQELLEKGKMGALAIIRNLRNMQEADVPVELVASELMKNKRPLLPFQFIAAAKACPKWEHVVDASMIQSATLKEKFKGKTLVLVDVSGSMDNMISSKSTLSLMEGACAMAILLREMCENVEIYSFSNELKLIPSRHGMALRDAIVNSQMHSGTYLGACLNLLNAHGATKDVERVIVLTDEQVNDRVPKMANAKGYIINISSYQNGIKNDGSWVAVNGFSEYVIDYIYELEKSEAENS